MRRLLSLILLPALLIGVLSCQSTGKASKERATAPHPLSFRLKWIVYSSFATHFVALERGFFSDEGLAVDIRPGGAGIDPLRLVAAGEDDVGLATYDQILIAREKGLPLVAIGEDYVRSGVGFFSLASSAIADPHDFVGHKVGILPGTDKHTVYLALLEALHIDHSKITDVPVGNDVAVLLNGVVDVYPGFVTNQPFVAEERGIALRTIDPYAYGVRPGGNVYFTSENTLRTRPDDLRKFLRAVMRGIVVAQRLPNDEVIAMVLKHNPALDRRAELRIWQATKDILLQKDRDKVGLMPAEKWQYTADISLRYGLLTKAATISDAYTNQFVEEILKDPAWHTLLDSDR